MFIIYIMYVKIMKINRCSIKEHKALGIGFHSIIRKAFSETTLLTLQCNIVILYFASLTLNSLM